MKRLLALLLALLMPLCATAETYRLTLSFDTDETIFPRLFEHTYDLLPADQADAVLALLQLLMDNLTVEVTAQEDAMTLKTKAADKALVDFTLFKADEMVYLTSSLLPSYALIKEMRTITDDMEQALNVGAELDWDGIGNGVKDAVNAWTDGMTPRVTQGVFAGDAYEGGTVCTTWTLTDAGLAALLSAVATEDLRAGFEQLGAELGMDAAAVLAAFDAKNEAVTLADTYMYILRLVEDREGALCGISFTIFEGEQQVATISVGCSQKAITVVLGLGLAEENYWWRFTANKAQMNNVTLLKGSSQEWMADKLQSFSYVSATNAPLTNISWQCNLSKSGKRYLWDASLFEENDQSNVKLVYLSTKGTVSLEAKTLDATFTFGASPDISLELHMRLEPAEAIAAIDPATITNPVAVDAEDAIIEELSKKLMAACLARLIKLVPSDVMQRLLMIELP